MTIYHQGEELGKIREVPVCFSRKHLEVWDQNDEKIYDVTGPCCPINVCGGGVPFKVSCSKSKFIFSSFLTVGNSVLVQPHFALKVFYTIKLKDYNSIDQNLCPTSVNVQKHLKSADCSVQNPAPFAINGTWRTNKYTFFTVRLHKLLLHSRT